MPSLRGILSPFAGGKDNCQAQGAGCSPAGIGLAGEHGRLQEMLFTSFLHKVVARVREAGASTAVGLSIGYLEQAGEALRLLQSLMPSTAVLPAATPVIDGRQVFTDYVEQAKQHRLKLYVRSPTGSKPWSTKNYTGSLRSISMGQ